MCDWSPSFAEQILVLDLKVVLLMEFSKCLDILQARQQDESDSTCPCRHQISGDELCLEIDTSKARYGEITESKTTLELINNFLSLQEERVKVS